MVYVLIKEIIIDRHWDKPTDKEINSLLHTYNAKGGFWKRIKVNHEGDRYILIDNYDVYYAAKLIDLDKIPIISREKCRWVYENGTDLISPICFDELLYCEMNCGICIFYNI